MISPSITVPSNATDLDLKFWYSITSDETTTSQVFDKLEVYLVRPGNQLNLITSLSNLDKNGTSYGLRSMDISSSFYGNTVQIFFKGTTDSSLPTVFRIDDVTLEAVVPSGGPPSVSTLAADQIAAASARLNMTVNPNGADTEVWFDLDPNDSTPSTDTVHFSIGGGTQSQAVSWTTYGLTCGTTYYFRAHAGNAFDSDESGSVLPFTTPGCSGGPPRADTEAATNITKNSATLNARPDANGLTTQAWFGWGESSNLGLETPRQSIGSAIGKVNFSYNLTGLACGRTYYFENRVANAVDEDDGATLSFTTDPCDLPSPSDQLLLFASRQACAGTEAAVLLGWTMPSDADRMVTIRRSDGQYVATVNTAVTGPVFAVDSGLLPGNSYRFTVEAVLNGSPIVSNEITVPIASDECRPTVAVGDLPHRPVLWAEPAFCENGVAKVKLFWTEAVGAESYSLQRVAAYIPTVTYDNLTGRSFIDELPPGGAAVYLVSARNGNGSVNSWNVGVIVPGTVCSTTGVPGPFSASADSPICEDSKGAVTVRWGQSSGAASRYRVYELYDHQLVRFSDNQQTFVDSLGQLDPGIVLRAVVQAESATTAGKFREAYPAPKLIPLDVCGTSNVRPGVGSTSASYVREDQALLKVSISPNSSNTSAFFEWGTSTAYGSVTPSRAMGSGYGFITLGQVLTGLSCGTTYHFRGVAINAYGRTDGADQSFTTSACTVPVVSITATDATATENPMTSGTFLIQRTGSTAGSLTVTYTVGGTATVGIDHTLSGGNVTIPAGSASQTLTVFPLDDSLVESDETVVVTLQPQSQYVVGSPSSATVTIVSDEVPEGGGCGRILVHQERDQIGGCDASDTGIQWWVAENFKLADRRDVSCLEVLGYYWPGNNPPPSSLFDVVFYEVAGSGAPGAVVHEDRGVHVLREKTGNMSGGMEEWRFTIELTTPVDLAAGNYFVEVAGAAGAGGSFCWSEGQIDPVAGLGGLAFRQTGQWSLGNWSLAFKVFEAEPQASDFYTVTPCRVADTRDPTGPFGGPALSSGNLRAFTLTGRCGVPVGADAVAMNVTVVNAGGAGNLTLFPGDQLVPGTSSISFSTGQTRANNSVIKLSSSGTLGVWPTLGGNGQVHFIIDVVGYFAH